MKPDDNDDRRMGTPLVPQRSFVHTPPSSQRDKNNQAAAANIVRDQLDSIYGGNTSTPTPQTTPVAQNQAIKQQELHTTNPYERIQSNPAEVNADQWKQYHSAWQDYYQKYYERYYVGQVYRAHQEMEARAAQISKNELPANAAPAQEAPKDTFNREEALYDLRNKLLGKVNDSAKKVRKSQHFVPVAAAACVVVLFLFLQYNRVLFANVEAYISPGSIDPANIIVDPLTNVAVSPEPKLIIPKINVDVPVEYEVTPDYDAQMKAMEGGVAWFGIPGANSKPGQIGNTVLSGHSSNDIIDPGAYKFIFAQLERLAKGDTVYANYNGIRYTYVVTKIEIVKPTEVNKLIYPTDKPVLTLITCTPLGTSLERLLVTAEQVSPSPSAATAAPESGSTNGSFAIPGNSPTLLQRIFGE
ncbi:MAG: sortase family protein [Candidatus Saccharibacteria bacterium]|jgi:sortase A|nr:sortase family protein [Candidatus Saccharibacteria bacterium]